MIKLVFLLILSGCAENPSQNGKNESVSVQTGAMVAWHQNAFSGNAYAILTNTASQAHFNLVDSLAMKNQLKRIFSPEHGFRTDQADGEWVRDQSEYKSIPVISLYGKKKAPTVEDFTGIDTLLIDLQDVGLRWYTYLTTIKYCLSVASSAGIPVVILDRPNPLGGIQVDGPVLSDSLMSFIGSLPIPVQYGLTVGELFSMVVGKGWIDGTKPDDLVVRPLVNWKRSMNWTETGLPWVPTSPNLPDFNSVQLYAGTCLFEGTSISEGRGTDRPFRWFGAPWLVISDSVMNSGNGLKVIPETKTPVRIPGKSENPKYQGVEIAGYSLEVEMNTFRILPWVRTLIDEKVKDGYPVEIRNYFFLLLGSGSIPETKEELEERKAFRKESERWFLYD